MPEDEEPMLWRLCDGVDAVMKLYNTYAQKTTHCLKRIVNLVGAGVLAVNPTPMRFDPEEQTLEAYRLLPKRFLCYLIRYVADGQDTPYIRLNPSQVYAFAQL